MFADGLVFLFFSYRDEDGVHTATRVEYFLTGINNPAVYH